MIAECGRAWDALETPEDLALPVLVRLHAADRDRPHLGPVMHDADARIVYWLLRPGSGGAYPDGCLFLPSGAWLPLPHPQRSARSLAWLYLPDTETLTAPAWLAAALTHSGGDPVRSHPDDAAFLDRLSFTTGQPCEYGQHPAAPTVRYGETWICREDLAYRLRLEREQATDAGREHTPTLTPAR